MGFLSASACTTILIWWTVPIIMVTSIANTDYAELFPTDEFIHINAFLSKPISADELIRQVNKYLPKN